MIIKTLEKIPLSELVPYENNPRLNDYAVADVMESIRQCENLDPIEIDEDNIILAGHTRRLALIRMGVKKTEVIRYTGLTEEQKKKYRLLSNKTNERSLWDFDKLEEELAELDFEGFDFGFDIDDIENDENESVEIVEDEPPEEAETRCKLGDVWKLGEHRLICGDSTDIAVIDRLMDGNKAKLLLTDPPYGIDVVKGNKVGGDKAFGKVGGGGQTRFGKVDGGNIVKSKTYSAIIGDDTTDTARANYNVAINYTDFLKPSRCWIVWDKQNTGNFADAELAWTSFDKGVRLYHFLWNGLCREGSREVEGKTRVHPTQKPVGMLADILKDFSEENDSILDCFGGSGSTLIACEQLNRKCYMAELDPHYCDVIIERWENLTGKKAVLIHES